jgi:XapX domain-containing protein
MKVYLLSLGAGVLVGVIYSLIHVRSPAPPLVALIGLLGILGGEQVIPVSKHLLFGSPISTARHESHDAAHMPGMLPSRYSVEQASRENANSKETRS